MNNYQNENYNNGCCLPKFCPQVKEGETCYFLTTCTSTTVPYHFGHHCSYGK